MEYKLLTRSDVASKLGVSTQTIYRWEREGRFVPSIRSNKLSHAKYLESEVDEWINKSRGRAYT